MLVVVSRLLRGVLSFAMMPAAAIAHAEPVELSNEIGPAAAVVIAAILIVIITCTAAVSPASAVTITVVVELTRFIHFVMPWFFVVVVVAVASAAAFVVAVFGVGFFVLASLVVLRIGI